MRTTAAAKNHVGHGESFDRLRTGSVEPCKVSKDSSFYCLLFAKLFREPPSPEVLEIFGEQGAREDIAVVYARLFAVPGEASVAPYESAYRDRLVIDTSTACSPYFSANPEPAGFTGYLNGPSATAVRDCYRLAGFEVESKNGLLPDHLSVELEFMGRLFERGDESGARQFFEEHLGRWAFTCLADIQKKTDGFYGRVADACKDFLFEEQIS